MAEKLTPSQQMAVDNRGGKLLVSAAAGSGKTKVLVDRLLKYIRDPYDLSKVSEYLCESCHTDLVNDYYVCKDCGCYCYKYYAYSDGNGHYCEQCWWQGQD